jgi:monovalent cation:H+ antiporter-2, CPA2 family
MDQWNALFDILVLLSTAMVLGVLAERLKQSSILGYLAAGTLVGPKALGLISSSSEVAALAELGVALLLFTIGLEFSWRRLRSLGGAALGGGAAQIVATLAVGAGVALIFGMQWRTAATLGAILALSSTACVLRILISRSEIESVHGRHALGFLLVQDIALVPLVLLITALSGGGSLGQAGIDIARALGWAAVLVLVLYALFNWVVPRLLHLRSLQRNRELPILLAIVTGLGSAWSAHLLHLSPALGAFVAGMLLAESPFATQIRADVASLRTVLVTLFFSSIGMLGDPYWFVQNIALVLAVVVAIVVGKALIIWAILRSYKLSSTNALATGICLGQVGEFSFVLAEVGRGTLIDESLFALIISATITTLFLSPYLVVLAPRLSYRTVQWTAKLRKLPAPSKPEAQNANSDARHFLIIGYGPAGEAVGRSVEHLGNQITVVDLNPNLIRQVAELGFNAHIGDATQADVLEHVGVKTAAAVIVTIPDATAARGIVELVRSIAPDVHIIARSRYHRFFMDIKEGGADEVVDEEQVVGKRLAANLRRRLG